MRDTLKGAGKFLAIVLIVALVGGGVMYAIFMRGVAVGHNGMAPTIVAGDEVLVWRTHSLEMGDVALCPHPQIPGRFVMGRVMGRVGHTLRMERGQLQIDGESPQRDARGTILFHDVETDQNLRMRWGLESMLDHDYTYFEREHTQPGMRDAHVTRGVFLLGDNRTYGGEDSRSFGTVDPATCIGQVFMRLWPAPAPSELGHGALDILW